MTAPYTFRIHFKNGSHVDVIADTPDLARKIVAEKNSAPIAKIKVLKENRS